MRNLPTHLRTWQRRAGLDVRVLRRLFPWRVALTLCIGVAVAAAIFQQAYRHAYGVTSGGLSYVKAVYAILNMAAFQVSYADMPPGPALDAFFVVVPLLSVPLLLVFGAQLFHVLRVFFVRADRGQMWQRALAATVTDPIIVCGLGHVGYRVARQMLELGRPVIGIDMAGTALTDTLMALDMPVILGDVRDIDVLRQAGVMRASTVVVCTHDDLANIEAAFHVHELNPDTEIVLRLFEDDLADDIVHHLRVRGILSRSAIAAQTFAYAALGLEALETFTIGEEVYVLAEVPLGTTSSLVGHTIDDIAVQRQMTVVCLARGNHFTLEPPSETVLETGDVLFVFTDMEHLAHLADAPAAHDQAGGAASPVIVCGLGHTGYRVVRTFQSLGHPVVAVDFAPGDLSDRLEAQGVRVVYGDSRRRSVLLDLGLTMAEAIVVCTEDDLVNLQVSLRAREMMPQMRVVLRIFEERLGLHLRDVFGIDAVYSTSEIAAPAFVAAALDIHATQPVLLGGEAFLLARIGVEAHLALRDRTVAALTQEPDVTVLLHTRGGHIWVPPDLQARLEPGDEIVILASRDKLRELTRHSASSRKVGLRRRLRRPTDV